MTILEATYDSSSTTTTTDRRSITSQEFKSVVYALIALGTCFDIGLVVGLWL
jgi:hypothetical protein